MLLLDENLSPRLVARISTIFPNSLHVLHAKLDNAPDIEIWYFARKQGLAIVSKDRDFLNFSQQYGTPPKLIYLQTGNCRLVQIEQLLKDNVTVIQAFLREPERGVLQIG
ncbi:DUF5615 family PIN-like protein [Endozoicomonas sp.]|uniref:DUF5615 family PIN-like protein n=1 Tax=Endozoicomonas sp. TaxID=1892382 RepID=UPI002886EAF8|nr:DUF5615 family PIN-like protein [Endozoicomonas sp.]